MKKKMYNCIFPLQVTDGELSLPCGCGGGVQAADGYPDSRDAQQEPERPLTRLDGAHGGGRKC